MISQAASLDMALEGPAFSEPLRSSFSVWSPCTFPIHDFSPVLPTSPDPCSLSHQEAEQIQDNSRLQTILEDVQGLEMRLTIRDSPTSAQKWGPLSCTPTVNWVRAGGMWIPASSDYLCALEAFKKFFGPKCPQGIVGVAETYKVLPVPEEKTPGGCSGPIVP